MNRYEIEAVRNRTARAHARRKEGVEYQLRMIPGSGGQLELVELEARKSRMLEWAHLMNLTGYY